jgi:thiol:disulfide interchange protein
MKKFLLLITALAVTTTLIAADFPKGSPKFLDSHRRAMSAAKKEGKPVVLVFSASWCPPCQTMKKEVYPSEAVKAFHDKFVWAYLDVDDNDNEKPSKEYGVNGIPHIEFVDADGKSLIEKQVGSGSPESFAKRLESALAKVAPTSAVK